MDEAATQSDLELELEARRSTHSHPLDPISLAFGVVFTILGGVFFFGNIDTSELSMAWAWAGLFGAVGLLLLAVGARRHRNSRPIESADTDSA